MNTPHFLDTKVNPQVALAPVAFLGYFVFSLFEYLYGTKAEMFILSNTYTLTVKHDPDDFDGKIVFLSTKTPNYAPMPIPNTNFYIFGPCIKIIKKVQSLIVTEDGKTQRKWISNELERYSQDFFIGNLRVKSSTFDFQYTKKFVLELDKMITIKNNTKFLENYEYKGKGRYCSTNNSECIKFTAFDDTEISVIGRLNNKKISKMKSGVGKILSDVIPNQSDTIESHFSDDYFDLLSYYYIATLVFIFAVLFTFLISEKKNNAFFMVFLAIISFIILKGCFFFLRNESKLNVWTSLAFLNFFLIGSLFVNCFRILTKYRISLLSLLRYILST